MEQAITFATISSIKQRIMDIQDAFQGGFERTKRQDEREYIDNDIVFLNNVKDLPLVNGSLRMDKFMSVICYTGKLQLEINMKEYTIVKNNILICRPDDTICNTMLSPDFEGAILCLSPKFIMEQFGKGSIWNCIFQFEKNPVFPICGESMEMFELYDKAFHTKQKMESSVFRQEIVRSIVKAIFYELRENICDDRLPLAIGSTQKEILFKKFMELLSDSVAKSRQASWYAGQLHITPKYLSVVCKQVSGKTAFEWINEYVIMDIRHLLKNTDKPIKEVVSLLKFPNVSFFGSYCRKHFGMSPMEYRRYLRTSANNNDNI